MPTREDVFAAADELLGSGERPSYRKVTARLRRGGAPRVVLDHLRDWREERGYRPALDVKGLPEPLQAALARFARDAWEVAREGAALVWTRERETLEEIRLAEAEDREHLLGLVERSLEARAAFQVRAEAAEAERDRLLVRVEDLEGRLPSE